MLVRWWWSVPVIVVACLDNPNIDGSKVPPDNNPAPACADICPRIEQLCGYAPLGNDGGGCTNDAATGYCDTFFGASTLQCIAVATSCRQVWDTTAPAADAAFGGCQYIAPTPEAGMDDAGMDDGAADAPTE